MTTDTLVYHHFRMTGIQTERFEQSIRYVGESEDAEELRQEFFLAVSGNCHIDDYHFLNVQTPTNINAERQPEYGKFNAMSASEKLARIQAWMMQPHNDLEYWAGGVKLLDVTGDSQGFDNNEIPNPPDFQGKHRDVDNGPRPQYCNVVEIMAGNIYRIEFGIRCAIVNCCAGEPFNCVASGTARPADGSQTPQDNPEAVTYPKPEDDDFAWGAYEHPEVVNHTWSYTDSKDNTFYSTKTLEGVLRVSHRDLWPHMMRYLCVPPLAHGYQRTGQKFIQQKNKLSLAYEVTDRQRFAAPPKPAVDWQCTHTETLNPYNVEGGTPNTSVIDIMLQGAPGTNKSELIKTCLDIVQARLGKFRRDRTDLAAGSQVTTKIIRNMVLIDDLPNNTIRMGIAIDQIPPRTDNDQNRNYFHQMAAVWLGQQGLVLPNILQVPELGGVSNLDDYEFQVWKQPGLYDAKDPVGIFASYLQSPCRDIKGITQPAAINLLNAETGEYERGAPPDVLGTRSPVSQWPAEVFETAYDLLPQDFDTAHGYDLTSKGTDPLDPDADYQGNLRFPYTTVLIDTHYDNQTGTIALPLADTGAPAGTPTVEIFTLHRGVGVRTSRLTMERRGDWPVLPKLNSGTADVNGIAEHARAVKRMTETPFLDSDGRTMVFRVHADYEYVQTRPPSETDRLRGGSNPCDITNPANQNFNLVQYLTDEIYG